MPFIPSEKRGGWFFYFKSSYVNKKGFDTFGYLPEDLERRLNVLEILDQNPAIKVVISDMRMPHMDGIQFISKAKVLYPDLLFYMLSGYDITADIQKALSNGLILKYFQKPFKMEEIDRIIEEDISNQ